MTAEEEHGHEQVWPDYLAGPNAARDIWMNSPWVRDRQERSRALMQVTFSAHVAFNIAISPRHNFPFFDRHPFHHPIAYSWGLCCSDFHYRHAFVDGARSSSRSKYPARPVSGPSSSRTFASIRSII
jgi:hypothetical protein